MKLDHASMDSLVALGLLETAPRASGARHADQVDRSVEVVRDIIARLAPRVKQTISLLVRDLGDELDDLVNTCLAEILSSLRHYKGEGSLEAWAATITYRVTMRHLKRRRRRERTVALVAEPDSFEQRPALAPEQRLIERQLADRLLSHLEAIPLERRVTLVFKVVQGYSVKEIAELTGVPLNTARDRIRVALAELRQSLGGDATFQRLLEEKRHGCG